MTFYEVPSDERDFRLAKKENALTRSLINFSPTFAQQEGDSGFGQGQADMASGVNLGNFVMNPQIHYECVEIAWTAGSGTIPLKIGDVITTDIGTDKWQGRLLYVLTDLDTMSTAGTGVFEPLWKTEPTGFAGGFSAGVPNEALTDVTQTLSTTQDGGDWTATYTETSLNTGGFVSQSASMICDRMEGGNPTLDTLYDAKNTGQVITMKPLQGKTLNVNTGGNLNITTNTTVADTDVAIAQFFENSDIDPTGNKWNFASSGSGGGGGGTSAGLLLEPVRVASTLNNSIHPTWGDNIDGWQVVEGDRFLVKDQTTLADNGIYIVGAVTATIFTATRAPDFDTDAEVLSGSMVYVKGGNTQSDSLMGLESEDPLTVGSSDQVWKQVNSNWVNEHDAVGNNLINIGYIGTDATNIASLGTFRLAFDEYIAYRDVTNTWDATMRFNASDEWEFETNGVPVLTIQQGTTDFEQQKLFRVDDINTYTGDHNIGNTDPFHRIIGRRIQPSHMVYTTGTTSELRKNDTDKSLYIDIEDNALASFDIRRGGYGATGSLADSSDPWYRFSVVANHVEMQLYDNLTDDPVIKIGSGATRGEISMYRLGQDFSFTHTAGSPTQGIIFNLPFTNFAIFSDTTRNYVDHDMNSYDIRGLDRLELVPDSDTYTSVNDFNIFAFTPHTMVLNTPTDVQGSQDGRYLFQFAGDTGFTMEDTIFDIREFTITSDDALINSTTALVFDRVHATPVSGVTIGSMQWNGRRTSQDFAIGYGSIQVEYENIVAGTHSGTMRFLVAEGGGETDYMRLNDANSNEVDIFRDVDMNDGQIRAVGSIDMDGALATIEGVANLNFYHTNNQITSLNDMFYNTDTARKHEFIIGGTPEYSFFNTYLDIHTNYIRFDGVSSASVTTLAGEPKLFADSSNSDHLSIRSGGGTIIDLESASGSVDQTANYSWTGIHTFSGSNTNLNSASTFIGDSTSDVFYTTARLANGSNFIPALDLGSDLGDSTHSFSLVYFRNLFLDDPNIHIKLVGSNMQLTASTGNDIVFMENLSEFLRMNGGSNEITFGSSYITEFNNDIKIDNGSVIRSNDSAEIGFFVTDYTGSTGTAGSNQTPYIANTTHHAGGQSANGIIDGWFGAVNGATGLQYNSSRGVASGRYRRWNRMNGVWVYQELI